MSSRTGSGSGTAPTIGGAVRVVKVGLKDARVDLVGLRVV